MKKLANISLFLFVTALTLIFAEFVIRKTFPFQAYTDERNLTYRYDSELGWFPKENSTMQYQGSRLINVKHNSLGFRDIEPVKNNKPNIIFLGDSFTWGYDVEVDERLTEKLRQKFQNKFNILNFGVSGYGTDQQFLLLQKHFAQFKPKTVFVIFCNNDFDDNSSNVRYHGYFKPYFTFENNKLQLNGSPVPLSTNYKMMHFDENHPILAKSHLLKWGARLIGKIDYKIKKVKVADPTLHIFEEMNKFLNERGSKLVIATINYYPEMEKTLAEKKISYINLNNNFRYSSHGNHWTPKGHDFAANKIAEFLNKSKNNK